MKYKICIVTGTRADYGLLRETIRRFYDNELVELDLLVTGAHLSDGFGKTENEIVADGFTKYSRLVIPLGDDSMEGMVHATADAMNCFTDYFSENRPELIVVLGDRYEIFSAASAAHMLGIPIAHISGGDITEGAIDNTIRHCVTKMSQLHFPGCEQSRKRIIQMGEFPETVFNVGEPGVENIKKLVLMKREILAESLKCENILRDYAIVTFHPSTMEDNTGLVQLRELINAMKSMKKLSYIITLSNADAGGKAMNDCWIEEGNKHDNWYVISSLGVVRYLSAMKYAKVVIGNSSSGIVEAPSIGTPTVNIGDRQKGRMLADSVICCNPNKQAIETAIIKALDSNFQEMSQNVSSPFGDGNTSELIEKCIVNYLKCGKHSVEKGFYECK